MAIFYFKCPKCKAQVRKLLGPTDVGVTIKCDCGETMVRTPKGPQAQVVEVLDNGLMQKKVTRPADADRIYKERSINWDREQEDNK